jgi:hypothetical protein
MMIDIPDDHLALILPITTNPNDNGGQLMDTAIALHHIVELLDEGEDG